MVDKTEQIVREAPDIEAYKIGLLKSAKALSDKAVKLPQQKVAAMSGLQQEAINRATAGIGGYEPYLQESGYTLGDAQAVLGNVQPEAAGYQARAAELTEESLARLPGYQTRATQVMEGALQGLDPSAAAAYYNPFENQAVNAAMRDIARQGTIQQMQAAGRAAQAGAFGGSRAAIEGTEIGRNTLDMAARTAAQMRAAGFDTAANRALQASQQAAQYGQGIGSLGTSFGQLGLQGGQQIGSLGTQYGQLGLQAGEGLSQLGLRQAALGETVQKMGQQEQGFLFDLGKQQQAQQQAVLEAQRQTEMQQAYEPYQRVSFLSDIYKGAPSTQQTIAASTSPSVSPAQTILGLGIGGLSAAAGAQRAGLFG